MKPMPSKEQKNWRKQSKITTPEMLNCSFTLTLPVGEVVKNIALDEGSSGFDSRACQTEHSAANGFAPLLRRFLGAVLPRC